MNWLVCLLLVSLFVYVFVCFFVSGSNCVCNSGNGRNLVWFHKLVNYITSSTAD